MKAVISEFKRRFYFLAAWYFRFWAGFRLKRWKPTVVVVTGSNGKTTLLHLIESQLGKAARYSHHANSAIGIPFDILGISRQTLTRDEWFRMILLAPINSLKKPPKETLYIAEADCDRPGEGRFLATFLKPHVTLWINSSRTHSMNFEQSVANGRFQSIEDAIAYEFGHFIEHASSLVVINADQHHINKQIPRTRAEVARITKPTDAVIYRPELTKTSFTVAGTNVTLPVPVPEDVWYAVSACLSLMRYLEHPPDTAFRGFRLPPGRSSVLRGKKGVTIIDSSYNANLSSMNAIITMFARIDVKDKWLVISDMLEQGNLEREEHERLAAAISGIRVERIILMGPRIKKYTYPVLRRLLPENVPIIAFQSPKEVLSYLLQNLAGRETVLFKGGRFLEGVIEHLLDNPADVRLLCRREKIWIIRRKQWGL
jgi:UDP-N-acetylmuramoyl-tripeptide--D-alanyl-D-alanine ligase